MSRRKVFISYSHKDEEWRNSIRTQLLVLEREGLLEVWDDTKLKTGEHWFDRIHQALSEARVAVLVVTANYLTSNFVLAEEVPALLQRHAEDAMIIMPVIVRPCPWQAIAWLARMQVRPKGGRAVSSGNQYEIDRDFAELATEIIGILHRTSSRADVSIGQPSIGPYKSKGKSYYVARWILLLILAAATVMWLRPFGF